MSVKDDVMKMIEKKQKKNAAYKSRTAQKAGPYNIVMQFIQEMEKITRESTDSISFQTGLEREGRLLENRMKAIDPMVELTIIWNKEDKAASWTDLQVEGVKIVWSSIYLGNKPFEQKEKYISVASLFMNGMLTDL